MTYSIHSRSAKAASDWTFGDLSAYNIKLVREDAATFFGTLDLPQPQVDQDLGCSRCNGYAGWPQPGVSQRTRFC